MESLSINYKAIFSDIIEKRHSNKRGLCETLLAKKHLSAIDVLELNQRIFGTDKPTESFNQRHRSYSKSDILKILDYQKKHHLNNSQLATHFGLSRNSIAKWKKTFLI